MNAQRLSTAALLLAVLASAPACDKKAEGVSLPADAKPVTITTPVATATTAASPGATAASAPDAAPAPVGRVPLTASLAAHRRSTLSPRVAGTVLDVKVREGDRVKAGDVLVVFDTRDIELRIKQANAAIAAARVAVDTSKTEADRAEKLLGSKAIPERQGDLADAQLRGARAQLQQAQVAKEMAEVYLQDSQIKAPYDSVVIARHTNEGEYVMTMPPGPLVTLEETGVIDVRIQVPAARLGEVQVGTPVRIRVPARGWTRDAQVTRIVPTVHPMTRTATAIVELEDPQSELLSGLFAEVTVLSGPVEVHKPQEGTVEPTPEVTP